jgi:hypothetical protein
MTTKTKSRIKIALLTIGFAVLFLLPILARGQGTRPPVDKLSQQTDVTIATPLDLQPLRYDSGTSKWINSIHLGDIVIYSSNAFALTDVADFNNMTLMNKVGVTMRWSNTAGTEFPYPLIDGSAAKSIDVTGRKLYKTDGSSVVIDWSGSSMKFPQLVAAGATPAPVVVDNTGGTSVGTFPNAGTIPATTNLLQGDGAGNAVSSNLLYDTFSVQYTFSLTVDDIIHWKIENVSSGTSAGSDVVLATDLGAVAGMRAYGSNYPSVGMISGGDASIFSAGGDLLLSGNGLIRFGNDGLGLATQRAQLGNGFSVGTTADPGAGVVNVSSGYRIGNAAPFNHALVGNGVTYVDGSVPGKASVTSTVDQTATTETAHVVYTVPANSAAVGTVYRIHASGNVDNGTTGITFTPRIRWGGTAGTQLLATPTFTASTTANTNRAYVMDATVTIRAIGNTLSGLAVAETRYVERSTSTTGVETTHVDNSGTTAIAIDTTVNKDLDLTWSLSATTGTPHIRAISGAVEVVKP